jgi:hypothetical protein
VWSISWQMFRKKIFNADDAHASVDWRSAASTRCWNAALPRMGSATGRPSRMLPVSCSSCAAWASSFPVLRLPRRRLSTVWCAGHAGSSSRSPPRSLNAVCTRYCTHSGQLVRRHDIHDPWRAGAWVVTRKSRCTRHSADHAQAGSKHRFRMPGHWGRINAPSPWYRSGCWTATVL